MCPGTDESGSAERVKRDFALSGTDKLSFLTYRLQKFDGIWNPFWLPIECKSDPHHLLLFFPAGKY
jgi:hypothetical protein